MEGARPPKVISMNKLAEHQPLKTIAEQITEAVNTFQKQNTGHTPQAVTVVLSEDTLVITLHEALSPAERALATTTEGAAQIQEFHRQLFAASSKTFRQEIQRITGREVREATAEVVPSTGVIVHAFATGTVVQVFLLENENKSKIASESGSDSLTEQGF
jgi:uncharacterized protein YbcI